MILELKHLAPYLPYNLKVQTGSLSAHNISTYEATGYTVSNGVTSIKNQSNTHIGCIEDIKPLLVPLSELTTNVIAMGEIQLELFKIKVINGETKYCNMVKLFEKHIDVFGLIDAGLAIDKNTTKSIV